MAMNPLKEVDNTEDDSCEGLGAAIAGTREYVINPHG
jgi:hypothetical protein